MDQSSAIEAVLFFGQRLMEGGVRVSKLILFGSCARNVATDESDVDVLIISEDFCGKDIFDRAEIICDPERETIHRFQLPLDVIMMTPEEFDSGKSLIAQAARSGRIMMQDLSDPGSTIVRALSK